jgi:hypothetical protein
VKYAGFHLGLFFLDLPGWDLLFPVVWRVLVSLVVGTLIVPIVPLKLDGIPTMDASLSPAHNNIVYRSEYDVVIFISIQNSNLDMSLDSHNEALLLEMNNLY